MPTAVAPALRVLLEGFIDYAGIFPPAKLSLEEALVNYGDYRNSEYSWMLHSFVIDVAQVHRVPQALDDCLAVLSDTDDKRAASIESKKIINAQHPVYVEVPIGNLAELAAIKQAGCFAKIRTGGVKPEAIPTPAAVADFIVTCAEQRLPFKATAGLHHPIRAKHALTYEADAPQAVMHGFLNVLMAAAFAWHGERQIELIVAETDLSAFSFDESASWRNKSIDTAQIREARQNFMHSVGSCSFDEPVQELQALGLL